MCAVLPLHAARVNESQISLINQRRCLQRNSGPFAAHALLGQPPQLLVDERHELFERRLVAPTPLPQQFSDVSCHEERRTLQSGRELRLLKQDDLEKSAAIYHLAQSHSIKREDQP